jgi:hypothetical protein
VLVTSAGRMLFLQEPMSSLVPHILRMPEATIIAGN